MFKNIDFSFLGDDLLHFQSENIHIKNLFVHLYRKNY